MARQQLQQVGKWLDQRSGFSDYVVPLITHIVPDNARWWYVFGSATLMAFFVQVFSGICLAMIYVPGGDQAYESLKYITETAPMGSIVRGMHFYGATAMVVLAVIHMTQVYLHATYKYPREMNWMSGVVLLFVVLGMAFTGQLLRWDANGVWSVTVAAEMAGRAPLVGPMISRFIMGGETVGGSTLSRFFAIHVFILPGLIFAGVGLHMLLLFRHGVSEMPDPEQPVEPATYKEEYEERLKKTGVPFWPNAMWRDTVFSVVIMAVILGCSIFIGPPSLDHPPDPSSINANPMPDWYFWWYFAVLSMLPANLETWVILGAPVVGFLVLFLLPLLSSTGHRAPSKRPWAVGVVIAAATAFLVLTVYGYREPWSPDFGVEPLPEEVVGTDKGPIANGAKLAHSKGCLYCHDIDGYGGHRGPELSNIGKQLTREDLIIRINNGGYNMPAFAGSITSSELSDLIEFLKTRRDDHSDDKPET
ncbi:cytochrome b N-terminal domain-containing protein [Calycomorphotria hydatis]|uniref:Menaquinol-cytochrome c reductase cytochrome b subunit n=1 Tax=Calycomorphotria hydatis TaxID=2528027 RepID=A0A517T979_9PLAN|nr:cytochrome b N-terminal domain-containing protein [Calycomorphotria hydatis]QDT64942.1 Menaquinol-cytochrome c reductase cytochrome b subunit [Calycomorphotria hydatis]